MKKTLVLLTAIMIMSGCISPGITNTPAVSPQAKSALTPLPTNTETPLPPTATTVALPELETRCISILPAPAELAIEGIALFLDGPMIVSRGERDLQIPAGPEEPSVSPHNKFLAYHARDDVADIVVATSNGTVIRRVESNIAATLVGGNWISDEYIRHLKLIDQEQYQQFVVNIQTGESLDLRMDFPDMDDEGGWRAENVFALYYRTFTDAIYDPSLSRAAYPKKGAFISLYNVPEDREQAAIEMEGSDPIWSPDGQYFTFKGWEQREPREIYIISRDGNRFMPLTYLSQHYPQSRFGSYSWSPDSRKIAFWVSKTYATYGPKEYETLFIFDLTTMKMQDTCIEGIGSMVSIYKAGLNVFNSVFPSPTGKYFTLQGKPVWSPDSNKIIIAQFDEESQQVIDLLVDLERNVAYPIATGLEPVGWMSGEP